MPGREAEAARVIVKRMKRWRAVIRRRRQQQAADWEEASWERNLMVCLVYGLLLALVGFSFYLCCLYGIRFTSTQARAWITASLISFAADIIIQEPLVHLVVTLLEFVWQLGEGTARGVVVASVAARAGVEIEKVATSGGSASSQTKSRPPSLERVVAVSMAGRNGR